MSAHADRVTAALADRYRVAREIGEGGMATVYLARDLKHDRDVAIKVVHPDLGAALGGERFLSEIRTTARLQHPHILPLLDSGAADGLLYYVMPLVTGESLRARLERERQLPIADALRIAREVAGALDHAHRNGVIHRDIKPENILLQDGAAVVADFGIALALQSASGARMTQTGLSLGTPQYMSPEQAMGERTIDARSDIYALGVVTFEMLAGDPPFTGSTVQALIARVMNERPTSLRTLRDTVSSSVDDAVLTALAKLPADRHASAAAFAEALARSASSTSAASSPTVSTSVASLAPTGATRARSRVLFGVGAVVALALAALAGAKFGAANVKTTAPSLRATRLTHGANVGCAAISPDGKRFAAIVGAFDYDTYCSGSLIIRPYPTGPDVVLARGIRNVNAIAWSPDEAGLLISGIPEAKENGVYYFSTRTGALRQLHSNPTNNEGFVDARHVYFTSFRTLDRVHIVDVESGDVVDSLPSHGFSRMSFSASGAHVVYANDRGLFIADRRGTPTDSALREGDDWIAWAGDTGVVIAGWDLEYRGVDPKTGRFTAEHRALIAGLPAAARNIVLSRDASRLTLVMDPTTDELVVMDVPRAPSMRVLAKSLNGYLGSAAFAPGAARVAYVREDPLGQNAYVFDLTTNVEQIVSSDTVATVGVWWLDDQRLTRSTASGNVVTQDLRTGRSRQATPPTKSTLILAAGNTWVFGDSTVTGMEIADSLMRDRRRIGPLAGATVWRTGVISQNGTKVARLAQTPNGGAAYSVYDLTTTSWSPLVKIDTLRRELSTLTNDGTLYSSSYDRAQSRTVLWRASAGAPFTVYATLPVHCDRNTVAVNNDGTRVVCNRPTHLPDVWVVGLTGK